MVCFRKIWLAATTLLPTLMLATVAFAQSNHTETAKLIEGTWNLDSMSINTERLPEAIVSRLMEKLQENKKHTFYFFGEDGKYISNTVNKTSEGRWELSESGDTLTLVLPDKTIRNKIIKIDKHTMTVEPLGNNSGGANGKIFMIKPEE